MLNYLKKIPLEYCAVFFAWILWGFSQLLITVENVSDCNCVFKVSIFMGLFSATSFVCTHIAIAIILKLQKRFSLKVQLLYSGLIIFIIANILSLLNLTLANYFKRKDKMFNAPHWYLINATEKTISIGAYTSLYFFIRSYKQFKEQKINAERAIQIARDAELQLLQQQLNPNFIFDTFHSLQKLINYNSEAAREIVTNLSEFLRFTLASYKSDHNTLREELDLLNYYLKIQQASYGDYLNYSFNVDPSLMSFKLPRFVLQLLVENSIKFGMLTSSIPLNITILSFRSKDQVKLEVINSGKLVWDVTDSEQELCLKKARLRLHTLYPDCSKLILTESDGNIISTISIQTNKVSNTSKKTKSVLKA